ncbi:MAG TPA: CPBP family intramembrane glutamic endopeptidase [Candidatus Thermoplasmatota archaeon]|nr:CPBP family intramembrane glutamic endopeptidase [Candidatus Thermoplasmatota archaeon]
MVQLTGAEFHVVVLTLSWVAGFAPLAFGRKMTWLQCVGLAMVVYPFARTLVSLLRTYELLTTPTVLQPATPAELWLSVENQVWYNLALPFFGLVLLHGAFDDAAHPPWRRATLREALAEHGVAPRAGLARDLARGLALFLLIAAAYLVAYAISQALAPTLSPGDDESQYWRNITIPLILLLSASAGVAEEFLYRGILLHALARRLPFLAAAFAQALLFGFAHAGYGSWTHVLGPLAFGLGMAWVTRALGLVPAMVLHAQVNVVFFTVDVAPSYLAANGAWGLAALLTLVGALTVACVVALVRTRADAVKLLWRDLRGAFTRKA